MTRSEDDLSGSVAAEVLECPLRLHSFTRACEKAEIEDMRFHDLRHTAATRMAEVGVDPFTIAEILSHKNIATTAQYSHATATAKRQAVAALEAASKENGPQIVHKEEQRSAMTAVG